MLFKKLDSFYYSSFSWFTKTEWGWESEFLEVSLGDPIQVVWRPFFSIHSWRAMVTKVDKIGITWVA